MKTFNLYWCLISGVLGWFLFVHTPPLLAQRLLSSSSLDVPFVIHLLGANSVAIACIINSLITPSVFHGRGGIYHVVIGRIGMIGGIIGFVFGAYCAWWPWRTNLPPLSFAIGITIGGLGQLHLQYHGYQSIKKYQDSTHRIGEKRKGKSSVNNNSSNSNGSSSEWIDDDDLRELEREKQSHLEEHIGNMIGLFVLGCGTPAFMRLVDIIRPDNGWSVLAAFAGWVVISNLYTRWLLAKLFRRDDGTTTTRSSNTQEGDDQNSEPLTTGTNEN